MPQTHRLSLPLTPMQVGMLLVGVDSSYPDTYLQQLIAELHEDIDIQRLRTCWEELACRHAALRTHFHEDEELGWTQHIYPDPDVPLNLIDWQNQPLEICEKEFGDYLDRDRNLGFEFGSEPPNRLTVFRFPGQKFRVLWTSHHSVLDGRSMTRLMKELWENYDGHCDRHTEPGDYAAFIHWLAEKRAPVSQSYWRQTLKDYEDHDFKAYKSRSVLNPGNAVSRFQFNLNESFSCELNTLLEDSTLTVNTVALGAWFLLVSCYTGSTDLVVGTVRSCRYSMPASLRGVAGLAINTLPFRTQIDFGMRISEWLTALRSRWMELRPHERCSLSEIRSWSNSSRSMFGTMHVHDRQPVQRSISQGTSVTRRFRLINGRNESSLSLSTTEGCGLEADLQADPSVFDPDQLAEVGQRYQRLLQQIVRQPHQPIRSIDWLSEPEKQRLIVDFNAPDELPGEVGTVYSYLHRQRASLSSHLALVCETGSLGYEQLLNAAKAVGREVNGDSQTNPTGILMDNKATMVVALLGVLSAGGSFVPMDPNYPQERLVHMIQDSKIRTLITQPEQKALAATVLKQAGRSGRIIILGTSAPFPVTDVERIFVSSEAASDPAINTGDWVYVVYTSGTTGKPKGVPITNANLMPLMAWQQRHFELGPSTRTISTLSFTFDFGLQEIFTTLMFGGTLFIPPPSTLRFPERFIEYLSSHQITMVYAVPAFIEAILTAGEPMPSLRVILLGGERLYWKLVDELTDQLDPGCKLFNGYGPTEASINCAMYCIDTQAHRAGDSVPIGRPSGRSMLYLLDSARKPVPADVAGELFIGGPGLSEGYLNQETLTAKVFEERTVAGLPAQRLYRTGDRMRFLPDGNLEFLGRLDNQIKLNGYRIELEDIEAQLGKHPSLKSVAVRLETSAEGIQRLAAYIVTDDDDVDAAAIRSFARQRLPSHMVPTRIWCLDEMPLTRNGKIDRERLRPAEAASIKSASPALQRLPFENWFHQVNWKKIPPRSNQIPQNSSAEKGSYLVFGDGSSESGGLLSELQRLERRATGVCFQSTAGARHENTMVMDATKADNFERLFAELEQGRALPQTCIYFNEGETATRSGGEKFDRGFNQFLALLQAIGTHYRAHPLKLAVVTRNTQAVKGVDLLNPAGALLHGLCKALPFEMPEMKWVGIDLDNQSASPSAAHLLEQVDRAESGNLIAFRNGQSYLWDTLPFTESNGETHPIRQGGTYLITGGLGAVGRVLAEGIASDGPVNIVLLDTMEAVASINNESLRSLRSKDCQVYVTAADICHAQRLAEALESVRKRFGKITGVIHAAGRVSPSILQQRSPELAAEILGPKVWGTELLAGNLLADQPDFVLLCSSIDAIRGSFNQADYCAANAFLDAYAQHMRQQGHPYISVNWDVWSDTGMAARAEVGEALQTARKQELALGISSEEGVKVLFHCLACGTPGVIVSTTPLKDRIGRLGWTLESATRLSQSEISGKGGNDGNDLKDTIYEIFSSVLDDPSLSDEDDIFQKGGDSIAAIRIVSRLKSKLGRNISIRSVFEAPTVSKMTQWLTFKTDSRYRSDAQNL